MSSLADAQAAPVAPEPPRARRLPGLPSPLHKLRADGLDLRNTWQIVAGAILLPVGIAVIIIGWSGAAHGRVEQQQLPYLISGGILGLALVVIGGFSFWAHWLYRIYDQADVHRQAAMQEHNELLRALIQAVGQQRHEGAATASSGPAATAAVAAYVATPSGTNYHAPGCPIVAGRVDKLRPVTAAQAAKLKPCRICEPGG